MQTFVVVHSTICASSKQTCTRVHINSSYCWDTHTHPCMRACVHIHASMQWNNTIKPTWIHTFITASLFQLNKLECGPMPNEMAVLPNIGGALFNAAKFRWRKQECHAVMLQRRETRWNELGCPKLTKRSQPLVGRSSPYCQNVGEILLYNKFFFQLSIRAVVAKT